MEFSPQCRGTRWEAYHHEEAKKSGSDYYNCKGFFFLVLLALVNAENRFLWIDCGSSGSCSDAQIFNRSNMREIEDGSLALPAPKPLREEGPNLHYFCWLVKPYSRTQLTREEIIANYRISRGRRMGENVFGILKSWFRVLLATMEQRPRVVRYIVYTWLVLHNMLRTHQGRKNRVPTPGNDVAALRNEQAVYVPNDNYRNRSREVKHQ